MQDDVEHPTESSLSSRRPEPGRVTMLDVPAAIVAAESAVGSRVLGGETYDGAPVALIDACREAAERGERVAVVAPASVLGSAREPMRAIARGRLGVVAHALARHGNEELSALLDLGWGVLSAAGPEDSFDLSLVARRAAEDSGVPFVVVHALASASSEAGRVVAMTSLPNERHAKAFVGPSSRLRPRHDPAHPSLAPVGDRGFGERLPFALGAAMRDYGALSGRSHDVVEGQKRGEHPLVLVGAGAVGEALVCAAPTLRDLGFDVSAVNVSAFRPFPGARIVKMLARALAITILEPADEPIAHAGPLVREVKSAFTDALTWAPGFPGIGRVPKLFTGATGERFGVEELVAVCENMLADETGRRSFSLADPDHGLARARAKVTSHGGGVTFRFALDDAASADAVVSTTAAALAGTTGLLAACLLARRGEGMLVDVHAAREHARGSLLRRPASLVVASERAATSGDVVARVRDGAVLGVTSPGGEAAVLTDVARAAVRERRARVVPLSVGEGDGAVHGVAGTCAGAAVAAAARAQRAPVDPDAVARVVGEHVTAAGGPGDVAAERARRAFVATSEAISASERDGRNGAPSREGSPSSR